MLDALRKAAGSLVCRLQNCQYHSQASTWEALSDHARYNIWSGDHFLDAEGQPIVYQVRALPREFFADACRDSPTVIRQKRPESRLRIL